MFPLKQLLTLAGSLMLRGKFSTVERTDFFCIFQSVSKMTEKYVSN